MIDTYYTLIVPWVDPKFSTKWPPTEKTGAFSVLNRGAFKNEVEAIERARLNGCPYSIRRIDP